MTLGRRSRKSEVRVLSFTPTFLPGYRGGGPIKSMKYLLDTSPANVAVTLVTGDRDLGDAHPYPGLSGTWRDYGRHRIFYLNRRNPLQWARLLASLRRERAELLYLNSSFSTFFSIVPLCLHRLFLLRTGTALVAPRGEFSRGALNIKSTKKRAYIRATRRLLYTNRVMWHASTELEAADIRRVHPSATILSSVDSVGDTPIEQFPPSAEVVRLVFIGRISPKKNLIFALQLLEKTQIRAIFDIYGPLEDGKYWSQCLEIIDRLGPRTEVAYRGELEADLVRHVFSHYDAFLFPSHGENFGHVIPEALSSGCLVLCSDETPWTPLLASGGGAAIPLDAVAKWEQDVQALALETPEERTARRKASLELYTDRISRLRPTNVLGEAVALLGAAHASSRNNV